MIEQNFLINYTTFTNMYRYMHFILFFKKLSESLHEEEGEHNNDYDHEAFLGREEAKTFDQLTPEESKERLA